MTIVGESSAKAMIWNKYIKIMLQVSKLILMTSFKNYEIKELKYLELLMLFSFFFFLIFFLNTPAVIFKITIHITEKF